MTRNIKSTVARSCLAIGLLFAGASSGCKRARPEQEAESLQRVSVQTARVSRTTLRPSLELVGVLQAIPERTSLVTPQLGGSVKEVLVVDSQPVRAGDVLVRLDDRTARADLARGSAIVDEKQTALTRLQRGNRPQEIEAARQDRDRAKSTMEALRVRVEAMQKLLARNEIPQLQFEAEQKALKSAEAGYKSADERAQLMEAGTRQELIEEADALLEVARADLEHARLALDWCEIKSPRDGVVVQVQARQGQYVDRTVPLATVVDLSEVFVQLRIPGEHLSQVDKGTPVDLVLPSIPKRTFQGSVWRLGSEADPLTGNVDAYALMRNDEGALRPGLAGHVRVSLPEVPDALAVPKEAISDRSGVPVVTVIRDEKAYEVPVKTGARSADLVQILDGLKEDDVVATVGGYGLPDGTQVQKIEASLQTYTP